MPRHPTHDYRSVCIYHITIGKPSSTPDFSSVVGTPQAPELIFSPLGMCIWTNIGKFSDINPDIEVYQYVIMPDHIHLLLHVKKYLDMALGIYISQFKIKILQMARNRGVWNDSVFSPDYHDRFLRPYHSLDIIYNYIRENPYRLLVRRNYPSYFCQVNNIFYYGNIGWQAYGNMQLLDNPFLDAVVCHRCNAGTQTEIDFASNWLHYAENGGVLISPFIARKEKEIRNQAEAVGGKIILIKNEPFGEKYKPAGHDFHQCVAGKLLIIAPAVSLPDSWQTFHFLNELAEKMAEAKRKARKGSGA